MKKIATIILLLLPLSGIAQSRQSGYNTNNPDISIIKFSQFYDALTSLYVDTLDNSSLIETAIESMLGELDPHSSYSSAEEMKAIMESMGGSFSGIGVEFDVIKDTIVVVNTITGGPAEIIGVMPNDRIITVDGESVIGKTRADVPGLLRGPRRSMVTIEVVRKGVAEPLKFRITRDNIPIRTIDAAYTVEPGIGYIKVNRFAETTMKEFNEAFKGLGKLNSLILDLRGNGGGLLDQAIELSEFFLPYGSVIVSTEGRNVKDYTYKAKRWGDFTSGNVVVLIDYSSASGSEIVAGAIQDWDRGIIIGQPSFGKGLVQQQIPLIDGSAVRITVARYHTPSGRVIQRPFEQGNLEDYYIDHFMRALDSSYADSVNMDAPVYQTLRTGRKVMGGGGINPDIYIPVDTTKNYSFWNQLMREGVINEFLNTYLNDERDNIIAAYPDFESFADNFTITESDINELLKLGYERGIEYKEDETMLSVNDMHIHLKAMIANKIWGSNEYYRIINREEDDEFAKAIEVIRNWNAYTYLLTP